MIHDRSRIINIEIEDELKRSYLEYSMSVIVSRALPDVRDGLKPSQRRIIYSMHELNLAPGKGYRKCAKICGDTSGNYHPHGEQVVYPTLVRMAQSWSMRYPLVQGQGNFGSIDGDPPAAMRYTEARLHRTSVDLMEDLDKDTVDYRSNYDETREEPVVFPSKFPNLLVNGSSGIAVGMATSIPPHNLVEVCAAVTALIDNPELTSRQLNEYILGPDFPTGGEIIGKAGILEYFETGRARLKVRGKAHVEKRDNGAENIIITEIPYQLNKTLLIEKIAELVKDKRIEGISDIRDESGRQGMRLVIVVKRNHDADIVLNQVFKFSPLQDTFSVINLALVNGEPKTCSMKEMVQHYIDFRHVVVLRRTHFLLDAAERRMHLLEGFRIAYQNLDEVIKEIRESRDTESAVNTLQQRFALSEVQAKAIVEMRLRQLTGLEIEKIEEEYKQILETVRDLRDIIDRVERRSEIIKQETAEMAARYTEARRTRILEHQDDFEVEDLIAEEDMVVTISHEGYIKRLPLNTYRQQNRGGRGLSGQTLKEEDFIQSIFVASTHAYILFFTDFGKCHWLKVYEIPQAQRTAKGKAIVNLIQLEKDEKIKAFVTVRDFGEQQFVVMATSRGLIKKTALSAYSRPRANGIIAIKLVEGDELIDAKICDQGNDVIQATKQGYSNRYSETEVPEYGRDTQGVRGIKLRKGDRVVSLVVVRRGGTLLSISENGYGKRTEIDEYTATHRGTMGVITIKTSSRNGDLVGLVEVTDQDDLMIVTREGMIIRQPVRQISVIGRNTQGVRLINLNDEDRVFDLAVVPPEDVEEEAAEMVKAGTVYERPEEEDAPAHGASFNDYDDEETEAVTPAEDSLTEE